MTRSRFHLSGYAADLADRAVKTGAQGAVLAIGSTSLQANAFAIDWSTTVGFALGGALLSILTNVAQRGLSGHAADDVAPGQD